LVSVASWQSRRCQCCVGRYAGLNGYMKNRISALRLEKGLSLTGLAKLAGTTKSQIQKLERGERRLSLDWMERISRALHVKLSDLLPVEHASSQLDQEERVILEFMRRLPRDDRASLVRIVKEFSETLERADRRPATSASGSRRKKSA
jgi:transcriptional regulator with XRE-family HTH domain